MVVGLLTRPPPLSLTPSISHPLPLSPPPSLFPDKKFPVEAHFWLDELFYYIDNSKTVYVKNEEKATLTICSSKT
jgi:hypothetical protein